MNSRNPSAVPLITGGVTGYFFYFRFFNNAGHHSFTAPTETRLFKRSTYFTDTNQTQIAFPCFIGFYAGFRLNTYIDGGKDRARRFSIAAMERRASYGGLF